MRVGFSILPLSRTDPAESVFVDMLVHTEPDLTDYASEPMVFPIFGRGIALYALAGKGINENNIIESCSFLVGPCSCDAKALNPGTDLLIPADWDAVLQGSAIRMIDPPPLVGMATLIEAAKPLRTSTPTLTETTEAQYTTSSIGTARETSPSVPKEKGMFRGMGALIINIVFILVIIVFVILFFIWLVARRTPKV